MNTIIAKAGVDDDRMYEQAAEILKRGGLVAFPTETVYGLGGDALNPDASHRIYAAKGRPSDNPLIVHIAETSSVYELAETVSDDTKKLMEAFWPDHSPSYSTRKRSFRTRPLADLIRLPSGCHHIRLP